MEMGVLGASTVIFKVGGEWLDGKNPRENEHFGFTATNR